MQATDRATVALVGTIGVGFIALVDVLTGFTNYAGPEGLAAMPFLVTVFIVGWYVTDARRGDAATELEADRAEGVDGGSR